MFRAVPAPRARRRGEGRILLIETGLSAKCCSRYCTRGSIAKRKERRKTYHEQTDYLVSFTPVCGSLAHNPPAAATISRHATAKKRKTHQ